MKAAVLHRFGKPEELQISEIDKPGVQQGKVLLRVAAIGINPVDTKIRAGTNVKAKQLALPAVLGWDVCGIVEAKGNDVEAFREGEAVFGCIGLPGTGKAYAEYVLADPDLLAAKPANISFEEAAAVSLVGLTAYQALHEYLELRAGQRILIQAAAGGVGHMAVQFAKLTGAYVMGTASAKNAAFLSALGVDRVIDYKHERFEVPAKGVDAVLDAMGGEVLYRSIACVKPGGTVLCLPSSTKDDPKAIALARERGITLTWPMMHPDGEQTRQIAALLAEKKLTVHVGQIFAFDEIAQAHRAVETHDTRGKVVVSL